MLSVLHVLSSLQLGGAERFTIDLAILQRQHGLESQILSLGYDTQVLVSEVERNEIPLSNCPFSRGRAKNYGEIRKLFAAVDVVHIHSPYALKFLSPLILRFPRKRIIYTRHGLAPFSSLDWRLFHQAMRPFVDRVTFVTSAGRDVFRDNHRWSQEKLVVVENGVLIPEQREQNKRKISDLIRFGAVGRLVALKGHRILLDTFDSSEFRGEFGESDFSCELHVYGSGPLEEELEARAAKSDHKDAIEFHGTVLDREAVYDNIDILLVCSETEGLSMVIIEAMARSIPVIATRVGGNPILVQDGENGILVPYNDVAATAKAMNRFAREPDAIKIYGQKARDFVNVNYSLVRTHLAYLECYGLKSD